MTTTPHTTKARPRFWFAIVLLGLVGQLAWTIENMYLNVFIYDTITDDPRAIAAIVAVSAIVATLTTLLMGALSDKIGRRRVFIVGGYILWGLSTAAFGFVSVGGAGTGGLVVSTVSAAVLLIIILDCVMTFFGSSANDAAFQSWITDNTAPHMRGRVESVLAIMPLLAMLVVFVALDPLTRAGHWREFFLIVGGVVMATGIGALFLVKDSPRLERQEEGYLRSLVHGLRPAAVRENPALYLTLSLWLVWGVSTQVFLPYLLIYLDKYLQIEQYAIVLGTVLIAASIIAVLGGRLIDRFGKANVLLPVLAVYGIGLMMIVPARSPLTVFIAGTIMMAGFMLVAATIGAIVRDQTPVKRVGHVQGLRMIFAIMVPMLIGPTIGAQVIRNSPETFYELGVEKLVPTPGIFAAAAFLLLLSIIPAVAVRRRIFADARVDITKELV